MKPEIIFTKMLAGAAKGKRILEMKHNEPSYFLQRMISDGAI